MIRDWFWPRPHASHRPGWRWLRRLLPARLRRSLLILLVPLLVGTVGYPLIEGGPWTWFDGLYMTVITLTTLGYSELHPPLSTPGRVFTMGLALGGIFTLFYLGTDIVRTVVTGELQELLGRQRMEDELADLSGHLIVCGFGRMGKIICDELELQQEPFVVIETAPQVGEWRYQQGLLLRGNATEDEVLRNAGIERARALVTAVASDSDNLYIALSSRLLNPKLFVVARAEEEASEAKLRKVGADKVILPSRAAGHRAVQAVLRPTVLNFLEATSRPEFADLQIEEVKVTPSSVLAGKSLREARLTQELGVTVVGLLRPTGEVVYAPRGDAVMEPGAILIVIGQRAKLDRTEALAAAQPTG